MPNDPQFIWQNQPAEENQVLINELLERAARHRRRARWNVIGLDVTYAIVIVFIVSKLSYVSDPVIRAGMALLALGCAYTLYRRHRRLWPLPLPANAPPPTGLETYRAELQHWLDDSREIWRLLLLPLLPGAIVLAAPFAIHFAQVARHPAAFLNAIPFFALLILWIVLMFRIRSQRLRSIRSELASLDTLLKQS